MSAVFPPQHIPAAMATKWLEPKQAYVGLPMLHALLHLVCVFVAHAASLESPPGQEFSAARPRGMRSQNDKIR